MKMITKIVVPFFFTILVIISPLQSTFAYTFDHEFKQLVTHTLPNVTVGLVVQDAKTGKVLYSSRAYEGFTPASTTKLFTAAAALEYLKPDFKYETRLSFNKAHLVNKQLQPDLILTFTGDPTLTSQDLNKLFERLKNSGVNKLRADIIVDHSRFKAISLAFTNQTPLPPQEIVKLAAREKGRITLTPDMRVNIRMESITWPKIYDELVILRGLCANMTGLQTRPKRVEQGFFRFFPSAWDSCSAA